MDKQTVGPGATAALSYPSRGPRRGVGVVLQFSKCGLKTGSFSAPTGHLLETQDFRPVVGVGIRISWSEEDLRRRP